jgi:predicted RNA-binding protein
MNYWLDLFTWRTWNEFLEASGTVSGFRKSRWPTVKRMKPGDILVCYMTGISRFFAILEVTGKPYTEDTPIWGEAIFPSRVPVTTKLHLPPEHAVPVKELSDYLSYFQNMRTSYSWSGHFRGSPTSEKPEDAQVIINALYEAQQNPVYREYDERKLDRKVPIYETQDDEVTIPDDADDPSVETELEKATHDEIQWLLLHLGSQMGLDVWVARNDKSKVYNGQAFQDIPNLRRSLPRQFDEATNRTIELIDVLWLSENAIVAAFEVEHTTSIYSGLLRMSDLISMQPNINIQLYIVAPDERQNKVITEVNRPTFSRLNPPLREICRFIPYSTLQAKIEEAQDFLPYLRPEFLDKIAESLAPEL